MFVPPTSSKHKCVFSPRVGEVRQKNITESSSVTLIPNFEIDYWAQRIKLTSLKKEFSGNECGCFHALFKNNDNNVFPVNHCSTNSYDFSKNDTEKQD